MPNDPKHAQQVAREFCQKFPKASCHALARKAFDAEPALWPTRNACYLMIRRIRGKQGNLCRKRVSDKSQFQPPSDRTGFASIPEGITSLDDWRAEQIDTQGAWLVMSDLHIPYHDAAAIRIVLAAAKKRKICGILLNGDVADCFAVSRWEKDPRKRDFPYELETLQKFFAALRKAFPQIPIIWKWGNHEERYDVWMQIKAPELLDIPDFDFARLTRADELGISTVRDKRPIKLGKLWVLHGHEYRFAIQNPVNPARGLFTRSQVSALCGHFHQSSHHAEKNLAEHVTSCWSTGCLCDLHPDYMPLNKWNLGAAFVEISKDWAYEVSNARVVAGKLWS